MSTNEAKPTPGRCRMIGAEIRSETGETIALVCSTEANGNLICEAFSTYHETGLTPRELAEQREELRKACLAYVRHVETTDGVACNRDVWRAMIAALAKTKPK